MFKPAGNWLNDDPHVAVHSCLTRMSFCVCLSVCVRACVCIFICKYPECAGSIQVPGISGEDSGKVSHSSGQAKGSPHLHAALQIWYGHVTSSNTSADITSHEGFETCLISYRTDAGFVYWHPITVLFAAGLLRTHNLSFQDSETLQAVFDKNSCKNVFRANPRFVTDTTLSLF